LRIAADCLRSRWLSEKLTLSLEYTHLGELNVFLDM
jgi:hypothetical protein